MTTGYVHGYSGHETTRLSDQANTLCGLFHHDTSFPDGSRVLEIGCGTGAQTVFLSRNSAGSAILSCDINIDSLRVARHRVHTESCANVSFFQTDVFRLPFPKGTLDHAFVCFLLEHVDRPLQALQNIRSVLCRGGSLTVIEGDHDSALFHPDSPAARKTIQCLVKIQAALGGDACIGRRLFPLLRSAGFSSPTVTPRHVYADSSRPEWVEGFTRKTFIAMVEGVREQAIARRLVTAAEWERGISDLYAAAGLDGTFSYTFYKAVAYA